MTVDMARTTRFESSTQFSTSMVFQLLLVSIALYAFMSIIQVDSLPYRLSLPAPRVEVITTKPGTLRWPPARTCSSSPSLEYV